MLTLLPHQTCPLGSICKYSDNSIAGKCKGLDPHRDNVFVCELWIENYEWEELKNARNDRELPQDSSGQEEKR
jgi:hypothetical protein